MPDPGGGGRPGRPLFAAAEERDMVTWIAHCAALGLVITREMFMEEVQRIVQLEQRDSSRSGPLPTVSRRVLPFVGARKNVYGGPLARNLLISASVCLCVH